MKRRKNSNLHVVREPEDPTDKIIEEIMDELNMLRADRQM